MGNRNLEELRLLLVFFVQAAVILRKVRRGKAAECILYIQGDYEGKFHAVRCCDIRMQKMSGTSKKKMRRMSNESNKNR